MIFQVKRKYFPTLKVEATGFSVTLIHLYRSIVSFSLVQLSSRKTVSLLVVSTVDWWMTQNRYSVLATSWTQLAHPPALLGASLAKN